MDKMPKALINMSPQVKFVILIVASIIVALLLVGISMGLYAQSGAAQLDLSRPSYQAVRSKVKTTERFDGFDASKPLDEENLDNFEKMYKQKKSEIKGATGAFSSKVLSDKALGIKVE